MDTQDRANREYNNLFRLETELYHDVAMKMGLSDSAFDILYCLDDAGDGCLQRDVCAASGLTKQTINSSVHKLARMGAIELKIEQGRGTHLYLTKAGRMLVEQRIRPVVEAEKAAFAQMGPGECEELLRLARLHLARLREQMGALPYPDGR